jgi:heme-degrading monooxygenase HmoA
MTSDAAQWRHQIRRLFMETVLIDLFAVPESSLAEFLQAAHFSAAIVRTQPGFVEGFVHERTAGESKVNVVTTAVWESESAMGAARQAVLAEFAQTGFNPPEIMKRLGVEMERSIYRRSSY